MVGERKMLKFITEQYLREIYKKMPFEIFKLEKEQRLTPGGRQFLTDKRIKIESVEEVKSTKNDLKGKIETAKDKNKEKVVFIKKNKYFYKIKSLESQLFSLVSENLDKNISLAQRLLEITRNFRNLNRENNLKEERKKDVILEDINIHDIYIHNKNAVEIFKLHSILYEINYLEEDILEKDDNNEGAKVFVQNLKYIKSEIFKIVVDLLGGEQC